jgi:hypothetical protein
MKWEQKLPETWLIFREGSDWLLYAPWMIEAFDRANPDHTPHYTFRTRREACAFARCEDERIQAEAQAEIAAAHAAEIARARASEPLARLHWAYRWLLNLTLASFLTLGGYLVYKGLDARFRFAPCQLPDEVCPRFGERGYDYGGAAMLAILACAGLIVGVVNHVATRLWRLRQLEHRLPSPYRWL